MDSGQLQSHPARAPETLLQQVRCDRASGSASRPIARGLAGPGLLAHVIVSKYADHLPLYRQSEIYAREGVDLERSTHASRVGSSSKLLEPLGEALRKYVMS